jgi:hypothetical protein
MFGWEVTGLKTDALQLQWAQTFFLLLFGEYITLMMHPKAL